MCGDSIYTKKIDFLKSLGSDRVRHGGETLLEHLICTHDILNNLGEDQFLLDAGLFHSVYGTVYFMPKSGLVDNRQVIIDLIGKQAEEIVYWFCIIDHPRLPEINKFEEPLKSNLIKLHDANLEAQEKMMTWEEAYGL
jgi:hypothetical protein|tara:strand:+ start:401 stop:814 length:414 start_codon:yes stop_codon:yes gene_type:complete